MLLSKGVGEIEAARPSPLRIEQSLHRAHAMDEVSIRQKRANLIVRQPVVLRHLQETPEHNRARHDTCAPEAIYSADLDGPSQAAHEVGHLPCSVGADIQLCSPIEF